MQPTHVEPSVRTSTGRDGFLSVVRLSAPSLAVTAALVWLLYSHGVDPMRGMEVVSNRLAYTLRCDALCSLMLLAGIWRVASGRAFGAALDPLAGAESRGLQVHMHYVQNTLEQLTLFVVNSLALSTFLDNRTMRIVPALTIAFVLGRIAFWIGYARDSILRAPGMTATGATNVAMLLYVLYRWARAGGGM